MFWRVVRVFHGLMSSVELQSKQREAKVDEERQALHTALMQSRRALAKSKVFYFSYFIKLTNRGVKAADQKFFRKNKGFRTEEASKISEAVEQGVSSAVNMELAKERIARSEAEAMFIALYDFLETHHEHLKIQENRLVKEKGIKKAQSQSANNAGKNSSREKFKLITNALKVKSSFEEEGKPEKDRHKKRSSYFNPSAAVFHLNTHLTSLDEMLHMINTPTHLVGNVGAAISSHISFHHSSSGSAIGGSTQSGQKHSMASNALSHIPFIHSHSASSTPSASMDRSISGSTSTASSSRRMSHHIVHDVSHAAHGIVHSGTEMLTHHIPSFLHHSNSDVPKHSTSCDANNADGIEHLETEQVEIISDGAERTGGDSVSITIGDNGLTDGISVDDMTVRKSSSNESSVPSSMAMPRLEEEGHDHHSIKMIDLEHRNSTDSII